MNSTSASFTQCRRTPDCAIGTLIAATTMAPRRSRLRRQYLTLSKDQAHAVEQVRVPRNYAQCGAAHACGLSQPECESSRSENDSTGRHDRQITSKAPGRVIGLGTVRHVVPCVGMHAASSRTCSFVCQPACRRHPMSNWPTSTCRCGRVAMAMAG